MAMALGTVVAGRLPGAARAEDPLLREAVGLAGAFHCRASGVAGFVLATCRDGETAVAGVGETAAGSGRSPDGYTILRIGPISKVFCDA